jgi:hypothetical protein
MGWSALGTCKFCILEMVVHPGRKPNHQRFFPVQNPGYKRIHEGFVHPGKTNCIIADAPPTTLMHDHPGNDRKFPGQESTIHWMHDRPSMRCIHTDGDASWRWSCPWRFLHPPGRKRHPEGSHPGESRRFAFASRGCSTIQDWTPPIQGWRPSPRWSRPSPGCKRNADVNSFTDSLG